MLTNNISVLDQLAPNSLVPFADPAELKSTLLFKMAGRGGDGGNLCFTILWLVILIFVGFWIAGFCAGFHILFQPFAVFIEGCAVSVATNLISENLLFNVCSLSFAADPGDFTEGHDVPENVRREHESRQRI